MNVNKGGLDVLVQTESRKIKATDKPKSIKLWYFVMNKKVSKNEGWDVQVKTESLTVSKMTNFRLFQTFH